MVVDKGFRYQKDFIISGAVIDAYASATGDFNPIHFDDDFAKKHNFKRRIAHGLLLGGFISDVLGNHFPGNGTIYLSQNLRFKLPAYVEDVVSVVVEIVGLNQNNWLVLKTFCMNQDGVLILDGDAMVIPPLDFIVKE